MGSLKTALFGFVLCLAGLEISAAHAQYAQCTALLENQLGRSQQTFTGNGYDLREACDDALKQCQSEIQWRSYRGDYGSYRCNLPQVGPTPIPGPIPNPNPYPYPGRASCEAALKTQYGSVVQNFYGQGADRREACHQARYQCQQELIRYQQHGRYAVCEITRSSDGGYNPYPGPTPYPNPGPGPGRLFTQLCRVGLYDYTRLLQTFEGTGQAYDAETARRNACDEAQRQCGQYRYGQTMCRQLDSRF
ncbi:MAG: hypothetical protein A2X86_13550 [Bdellovibrionales bacterium GWA2_49_15]|nr:MAG: hypothetical protein A2X86_13550 [Bdellovibrionales bacterium GWA2_49_15]HAZ13551.1 hypothetical protein [Bdellovibrionales bacterium]